MMNKSRIVLAGVVVSLFASSALFVGLSANDKPQTNPKVQEANKLESFKKLRRIMGIVEEYYVDELSFDEIVDKSIDGLLSNLDAHSNFLNKKKFDDLRANTEGEFGGIGITVGLKDGALTIIAPVDDTPGDKAGLKSGDVIIKVNDQSTIDMSIDDAVNLMRGAPRTKVELTIIRKGESKPLVFNIVRDIIKIDSVKTRKIQDTDYVYVRIASFDKNVTKSISDELKKAGQFDGIVLDLRNNPGGILDQAVDVSRLFIKNGVIVTQKGRNKNENIEYKAKNAPYADVPLVVLVNSGSASASEIVAGALQDHKRAVVIGEQTFGKGSVQTVMQIDQNEGLKLTTAKYYLPSGRTIQAVGVTPDIIVYPGVVPENENTFSIKEADLRGHLQGEIDKTKNLSKQDNNVQDDKKLITTPMLYQDIQLKSAVDVLRAWKAIGTFNQNPKK
ncbi:S41 family peptidase [Helicobacter sp. MIT 05-5293]|uniref:S41 family peptidase n=1 Tax=Helicobacter sp. MIT 05-5293 TaxID=1548149 RepID=UPI00051E099B|nr:S41 family peptidase [Helicobacter sp. MIT 05-5293]TLD81948.1 S41 family peptidase [Helicobacter sp. MIT 05-5293]